MTLLKLHKKWNSLERFALYTSVFWKLNFCQFLGLQFKNLVFNSTIVAVELNWVSLLLQLPYFPVT